MSLSRAAAAGSLGFIFAGAAQYLYQWVSADPQKQEEHKLVSSKTNDKYASQLKSAFDVDPDSYRIVNRLVPFENRHPRAYEQVLIWMGRLLFLEKQLLANNIVPKMRDTTEAAVAAKYTDEWGKHLLFVGNVEKSSLSAQQIVEAGNLAKLLEQFTRGHYDNICKLTNQV